MNITLKVLDFWLEDTDQGRSIREVWFKKDEKFDQAIHDRFLDDYERASMGVYDGIAETPEGSLALVIMLDQFPRNLFRGSPRAFSTDAKARQVSISALERGFDALLRPFQKMFLYLPFEHSEVLEDQERSVMLFKALGNDNLIDYAHRHRDIIARFGRFPHRNAALGRESTEEELVFLSTPGSSF
ncbi:MAG: DUF924 domain-containing protein [Rhodospirillales bacterium]|nr:DUF924 domain-containing protein [Rhodospirillales bacterium]